MNKKFNLFGMDDSKTFRVIIEPHRYLRWEKHLEKLEETGSLVYDVIKIKKEKEELELQADKKGIMLHV